MAFVFWPGRGARLAGEPGAWQTDIPGWDSPDKLGQDRRGPVMTELTREPGGADLLQESRKISAGARAASVEERTVGTWAAISTPVPPPA